MFCKKNANKTVQVFFLVSLKYREIIIVKTVKLYKNFIFSLKVLKAKKEAGTNFILLCRSKNVVGQFRKAYFYRPVKILHFLTPARFQKRLT